MGLYVTKCKCRECRKKNHILSFIHRQGCKLPYNVNFYSLRELEVINVQMLYILYIMQLSKEKNLKLSGYFINDLGSSSLEELEEISHLIEKMQPIKKLEKENKNKEKQWEYSTKIKNKV